MSLASQIKSQTAAVSFRSRKFGVRRQLDKDARAQAAQPFAANADRLVASKKVLDVRAEPYRAVTDVIRRARSYWKSMTVFFPVKGVRLIRRDLLDQFNERMQQYQQELARNVADLLGAYKDLKKQAKQDLGQLYKTGDYPDPDTLSDEFQIEVGFPSVEPPNYLQQLNPALYEQERQRVEARFEESMAVAQQALAAELQGLMTHLADKLTPGPGGKRKTLSKTAMKGLKEFVEQFKSISVTSSPELEALINQADKLSKGVDLKALKQDDGKQQQLFTDVTAIKSALDKMVVEGPDRKIDLDDE